MKKQVKYSSEDLEIKEWLLSLAKTQYPHADDFYAVKNLKDNWVFGAINSSILRHGSGIHNEMKGSMVKIIFADYKKLKQFQTV